jgi:hypothetical protein
MQLCDFVALGHDIVGADLNFPNFCHFLKEVFRNQLRPRNRTTAPNQLLAGSSAAKTSR